MKRVATGLCALLCTAYWSPAAHAQDEPAAEGEATGEAELDAQLEAEGDFAADADADLGADLPGLDDPIDDPLLEDEPGTEDPLADDAPPTPAEAAAKAAARYDDIVVVARKAFLKGGRVELAPMTGLTINDNLIRHYAFGGDITFFLTDVFGVGLQGMYLIKERSEREGLIGLQYNRTAALNKYIWSAALNFSYIPIYGKLALFNSSIVHWDIFASAGVGVTQSEIIPRKPSDEAFSHLAITPNFGAGVRVYLFDWMTVNVALRDYILLDKFEPTDRDPMADIDAVKAAANDQLVHNLLFYAGVGFYLPPSFEYRTPR